MKLQNFENHVPHSILTRGEDYYENDLIENIEIVPQFRKTFSNRRAMMKELERI